MTNYYLFMYNLFLHYDIHYIFTIFSFSIFLTVVEAMKSALKALGGASIDDEL